MEGDIWYYLQLKNMILFTTGYLTRVKKGITYAISHNYTKIKVD